jgi:hypothetical protein
VAKPGPTKFKRAGTALDRGLVTWATACCTFGEHVKQQQVSLSPVRLRHADVTLQVLEGGRERKDVAPVRGSTGMDGEQIVACNRKGVTAAIKV